MGRYNKLKDLRPLHPQTIEELSRVEVYYPLEWEGKRMRVVPADDDRWQNPCKSCKFLMQRNTHLICPMAKACMSKFRVDGKSVKFISDELSSLYNSEDVKEAKKADKKAKVIDN